MVYLELMGASEKLGIIDTLSAGFGTINRHLWLVAVPLVLDLLLLLGPKIHAASLVNQALDDMYGPRGGRGLAIRAARAGFSIAYEDFSGVAGVAGAAFKILPLRARLKLGLPGMARVFTQFSDQVSWVKEEKDRFIYGIDRCPVCWGRHADRPICHAALGLLQEGIAWATGRQFDVEELTCIARGDKSCTFAVPKKPIDG